MARPRAPQPVKLFCGLLGGDVDLLRRAGQLLRRRLGPTDLESEIWPFTHSDYYEAAMGPNLKRQFLSFLQPIPPESLAGIKHETNAIESDIAEQCTALEIPRPVNLDPGYVDLGKLVLATTKDRSHRIYIGQSMYAEVTLHFLNGHWQTWPWTYPDYTQAEYQEFFMRIREQLRQQRRESSEATSGVDS